MSRRFHCSLAVEAYLSEHQGCPDEIAAAVGHSVEAVRNSISHLRRNQAQCIANIMPKGQKTKPLCTLTPSDTIAQALASRTPLERAWR